MQMIITLELVSVLNHLDPDRQRYLCQLAVNTVEPLCPAPEHEVSGKVTEELREQICEVAMHTLLTSIKEEHARILSKIIEVSMMNFEGEERLVLDVFPPIWTVLPVWKQFNMFKQVRSNYYN